MLDLGDTEMKKTRLTMRNLHCKGRGRQVNEKRQTKAK